MGHDDLMGQMETVNHNDLMDVLMSLCGQIIVNKKAPIHHVISINDKVYRPL